MVNLSIELAAENTAVRRLVAGVIAAAKAQGIDQAALAARAGISAEALSRLKRADNCRLATLLRLARAAGFQTLSLVAGAAGHAALAVTARALSAGRRHAIGEAMLLDALRSDGRISAAYRAHLYGFFEELPIALVHDVVLDEGLDYGRLVRLARRLGAEGECVDWLKEMAGYSVAHAA